MEPVSTPAPIPRPGPATPVGPDIDDLRSAFGDLLADSAGGSDPVHADGMVRDHQVEALDAAHELLARALTELDSAR